MVICCRSPLARQPTPRICAASVVFCYDADESLGIIRAIRRVLAKYPGEGEMSWERPGEAQGRAGRLDSISGRLRKIADFSPVFF